MSEARAPRSKLLSAAIVATVAIVVVGNATIAFMLGWALVEQGSFGMIDAPDVAILHLLFTGIPMFALAVKGDARQSMWITAIGLSILSWSYFTWQIWRDSLTGFAGGANIGLGIIMLASPFAILLVLVLLSVALRVGAK